MIVLSFVLSDDQRSAYSVVLELCCSINFSALHEQPIMDLSLSCMRRYEVQELLNKISDICTRKIEEYTEAKLAW